MDKTTSGRGPWIVAAVFGALAAAAAGYGLASWRGHTDTAPPSAAAAGAEAMQAPGERKVLYWYDPMKPEARFDKPGRSPFMDMDLVARYADEAVSGGVRIDPRVAQSLGLRLAPVTREVVSSGIDAVGTLGFNERDVAIVQTRWAGFVERVYARAPGDVIAAGAPLVDVLVPEWVGAQQEYLAVRATGQAALTAAARQRLLLLGMPEALVAEVERSSQAQALHTVRSPIGGVIQELMVRAGMSLAPGTTLARINGLGTLWLEVAVPEVNAALLSPGRPVKASLAAYPGETFDGQVAVVLPETTRETRTLRVRIELPNRAGKLKAGMYAQASIGGQREEALVVPSEAVIRTGQRAVVFVADEASGRFSPVEVELGREVGARLIILKGLAEGQKVVVSGQFLLDSEASVSGMVARSAAADHRRARVAGCDRSHRGRRRDAAARAGAGPEVAGDEHGLHPQVGAADGRIEGGRQGALQLQGGRSGPGDREHHGASASGAGQRPMIAGLIRWSVGNRFLVLLLTVFVTAWGLWSLRMTPIDALPDLSDVQVIIRTSYPGQAPQIVENQVTYPLATTMLSVPGAKTVRGFSFFGDSFVYVLFDDGTDLYWARSRVLEYLNQVQGRLPASAKTALGPDATGVGWIFQYALVDRSGRHDLAELRSLQDWFLKYELKSLPGVAEVASVGGMVKQYQVVRRPHQAGRLRHHLHAGARGAAGGQSGDRRLGARTGRGRVHGARQRLPQEPGRLSRRAAQGQGRRAGAAGRRGGGADRPRDAPRHCRTRRRRRGRRRRRHPALGQERAGHDRGGQDAARGAQAQPAGRCRDRHHLRPQPAHRTRDPTTCSSKLVEEFVVVALVCVLFLWHLRSSLVAIISLPIGILAAFIVMHLQGINANIMSLGGIAIAIGAMVDAAVVMIENAHKKIEAWQHAHPGRRCAARRTGR